MKYVKTEAGHLALKGRSTALSQRQRAAFIVFDGKRTADEVMAATAGLGVTAADIDHLLALGFLAPTAPPAPNRPIPATLTGSGAEAAPPAAATTGQQRYQRAYPIATRLTAGLGLRGFRLNLAGEAAAGYEDLLALVPRIRQAVGEHKCAPLEQALAT